MDINFPLILVIAVFATGAISLFDWLFVARQRKLDIAAVDERFANRATDDAKQNAAYQRARAEAATAPAVIEYSKSFFPVLAIVLVLRSFVVEPFQIPSESMVPTLEVGDFILVNKFTYGIRLPVARTKVLDVNDPRRGDVMVFFPPNESRYFIKRVIGLPGDVLQLRNNTLYINGEAAPQEWVTEDDLRRGEPCYQVRGTSQVVNETLGDNQHKMRKCTISVSPRSGRPHELQQAYRVPEAHYFMMGDNRDNSGDSRVFGPVPEERIVGKAFAIWMHWKNKLSSLPSFSRAGIIQ